MRLEQLRDLGIHIQVTCSDYVPPNVHTNPKQVSKPDEWHELTGACHPDAVHRVEWVPSYADYGEFSDG
jgi:hypothetical protein